MSRVADIAAWAATLNIGDIPADVLSRCRDQRRSVLASMAASTRDAAARRVLSAVEGWAHDGPAVLVGTGRRVSAEDAIYAGAAMSMALDFDDYVCFGHTGHSGVLVPLALAPKQMRRRPNNWWPRRSPTKSRPDSVAPAWSVR